MLHKALCMTALPKHSEMLRVVFRMEFAQEAKDPGMTLNQNQQPGISICIITYILSGFQPHSISEEITFLGISISEVDIPY